MKTSQKLGLVFALSFAVFSAWAGDSTEAFYENSSSMPLYQLIQSAQSSINIEIYEVKDTRIQEAILNAMNRGVKVRVIQESEAVMSGCKVFEKIKILDAAECKVQKKFIEQVRSQGGEYIPYAFQELCNDKSYRCLEHGKIAIFDSKKVLISTGNFNPSNMCGMNKNKIQSKNPPHDPTQDLLAACNRDYSIVSSDQSVVSTLQQIFNADFASKAYDLSQILAHSKTKKLTVSPLSLKPILAFIRSAQKTIQIENQYLKDPQMNQALIDASRRGVQVFIMVDSACIFAVPNKSEVLAWTNTFSAFDQAGIHSRMFTRKIIIDGQGGYLHAKTILVDGERAWVGSVNGSTQALTRNREYGIFIDDPVEINQLNAFMVKDYKARNSETWLEGLNCLKDPH